MDKWEKFLTAKQNDDLPEAIELGIQNAFKQLPKKKYKGRITGIVAAAVLFFSIVVGSIFSPTMAATLQSIPIVGSLFEWIQVADEGIKTSAKQGIAEKHGIELQLEGHKLFIEETMFDGSRLAISFLIQAKDSTEARILLDRMIYKINDISSLDWGRNLQINVEEKAISDGLYGGTYVLQTSKLLPASFEFSVKTDNSWIPIQVVSKGEHTVLDIQKEKQSGDLTVIYKDMTLYPSTIILTFDEKQTVEQYVSLRDKHLDYHIYDEDGNYIPYIFGSGQGYEYENNYLTYHYSFTIPTRGKSYKKLSIIPTIYSAENGQLLEELKDLSYTIDLNNQ